MTNKYSEGYPGARYYGGNEFIDQAERLCQVSSCWGWLHPVEQQHQQQSSRSRSRAAEAVPRCTAMPPAPTTSPNSAAF